LPAPPNQGPDEPDAEANRFDASTGALDAELERCHEDAFAWALACCGWNQADAEDVLQTTYVKVMSGQARFGGRSTFRTWLFGVIRRTAREQGRRERSERERAERLGREPALAPPERPDEFAERAERTRALREALARLPERQREVLQLVFDQGLSIREAALVMEVSLGSARVHYERGKQRLRALLAESERPRAGLDAGGER
jgi:RNA polymerase sigma-70 factor (ECF subfamily)